MKLLVVVTAGLMAAAIVGAAAPSVGTGESVDLAVKGRANANASIDARGQFVAVAWGAATKEGTTDVFVAVSRDAGRVFRAPVRVNDVIGDVRFGRNITVRGTVRIENPEPTPREIADGTTLAG